MNLYGNTEGEGRTVFTGTVQVNPEGNNNIVYLYDIDFVGDGAGVGLSFSVNGRATDCTFTGWKTAVLGYGYAWVNVIGCHLADNQVGFHFNSTGQSANHSLYNDNRFENHGTAVLLESVPTDMTLDFVGSVFAVNGTEIDNRCSHSLYRSQAVFT